MPDISSKWVISVTIEKLNQLTKLQETLANVFNLAKGKASVVTIDVDTTKAEKKIRDFRKRVQGTGINVTAPTPQTSGRAPASAPALKLNAGELKALFASFDRSITRLNTVLAKTVKVSVSSRDIRVKLDSAQFKTAVTQFSSAVTKLTGKLPTGRQGGRQASAEGSASRQRASMSASDAARRAEPRAYIEDAKRTKQAQLEHTRLVESAYREDRARTEKQLREQLKLERQQEAEELTIEKQANAAEARVKKEAAAERIRIEKEAKREEVRVKREAAKEQARIARENARAQKRDLNARVNERYAEEAASRRGSQGRFRTAIAAAELETGLNTYVSQAGFSGFAGRTKAEQSLSFSASLNKSLSSLSSAVEGYTRRLAAVEESTTPGQRSQGLRSLITQGRDVNARQLVISKLIDQAAAQQLPGVGVLQGINEQYKTVRLDRIRQQAAIGALTYAQSVAQNPEAPDDVRGRYGAFAQRQQARLKAMQINNNTLKQSIALEEQLEQRLLRGANAFAVNTRAVITQRGAIEHFIDRVKALGRFVAAGYLIFGISTAIRNAVQQAVSLEAVFTRIQGILPGQSLSQRLQIEAGVIKAAQDFGTALSEAANIAKTLAQTGLNAVDVLTETRAILAATVGGGIEQGQAVETAVAVRNISQGRVSSEDIFSRIARVESRQAATGQDLAFAVQRLGALFQELQPNQLGTVDAFDALLGSVTEIVQTTRVTGNQAANALKLILSRLALPAVSRRLEGDFGVRLAGEGGVGARPATDILADIAELFQTLKETGQGRKAQELLVTVAGGRQLGLAAALFENFNRAMEVATDSSLAFGDIQRRTALQLETLESKFAQLGNSFIGFVKALGEQSGFFGTLKNLADFLRKQLEQGQQNPAGALVKGTAALFGISFVSGLAGRGLTRLVGGARTGATVASAAGLDRFAGSAIGTVAGTAGAGLFRRIGTRVAASTGVSILGRVLTGIASITAGWQIVAMIAGVTLLGKLLLRLFGKTKELEKYAVYNPITPEEFKQSAIGQDLSRYSEQFGSTPLSLLAGTQQSVERTRQRLLEEFPKEGEKLFQFDETGKALATNSQVYARFLAIFTEEMGNAIPGLQDIADASERSAVALRLFNRNIQAGSVTGVTAQQDVRTNFENLVTDLHEQFLPFVNLSKQAAATAELFIKTGEFDLSTNKFVTRPNVDFIGRSNFATLRPEVARAVGFGYGPETIRQLRGAGVNTGVVGNQNLILGVLRQAFNLKDSSSDFAKAFSLLGLQKASGGFVKALAFLNERTTFGGKLLGEALDELADNFLTLSTGKTEADLKRNETVNANRERFIASLESQLNTALEASKNFQKPLAQGETPVGGERFLRVYTQLLTEAARRIEQRALSLGQTEAAVAGRQLANAAAQVGNRPAEFSRQLSNLNRQGYLRDRLIELLGQFAIRENRIRELTEGGLARRAGRGFDAGAERIQSAESFVDNLAGLSSQIQLDIIKLQNRLSQVPELQAAEATIGALASEDEGRPALTDRSLQALQDLQRRGDLANPQAKALIDEIATAQAALAELLKGASGKDILNIAAKDAKERAFLLENVFTDVAPENLAKVVVTMQKLFDAAVLLERTRRAENAALERQLELHKQLNAQAESELEFRQELANIAVQENIRIAEITGRRGSLGAFNQQADAITNRAAQQRESAALRLANRQAEILRDASRKGPEEVRNQLQEAQIAYATAVREASQGATQDLARLLSEERTTLLQAQEQAITQATETSVSGLREVLSSFQGLTSGNLFKRILDPITNTLTSLATDTFINQFIGPGGLIDKQARALFGDPIRLQLARKEADLQSAILYERIKQAHIDGLNEGLPQITGGPKGPLELQTRGQLTPEQIQQLQQIGIEVGLGIRQTEVRQPNGQPVIDSKDTAKLPSSLARDYPGIADALGGIDSRGLPGIYYTTTPIHIQDQIEKIKRAALGVTGSVGSAGFPNLLGLAQAGDAAGKPKFDAKALRDAAIFLASTYGGAALGGTITGRGTKNTYASQGSTLGAAFGTAVGGPVGGVVGGLIGGTVGSLFGGGGESEKQFALLEKIERGQKATVSAIENQTRQLLSVDSRLFNVPASFVLSAYRPINTGSGNGTNAGITNNNNVTVVFNGATPPNVEQQVAQGVRRGLRSEGTFSSSYY